MVAPLGSSWFVLVSVAGRGRLYCSCEGGTNLLLSRPYLTNLFLHSLICSNVPSLPSIPSMNIPDTSANIMGRRNWLGRRNWSSSHHTGKGCQGFLIGFVLVLVWIIGSLTGSIYISSKAVNPPPSWEPFVCRLGIWGCEYVPSIPKEPQLDSSPSPNDSQMPTSRPIQLVPYDQGSSMSNTLHAARGIDNEFLRSVGSDSVSSCINT